MRSRILFLAIFLFAAALLNSSRAIFCPIAPFSQISASVGSGPSISLSLLAMLISFIVIGTGFMVNTVAPGTGFGPWLRGEYWEVAKSAMLIAIIFSLIVFIGNVAVIVTGPITGSPTTYNSISPILTNLGNYAKLSLFLSYCGSSAGGSYGTFQTPQGISGINDASNSLFQTSLGIGLLKSIVLSYWVPVPIGLIIPGVPVFTFGSSFNVYKNSMLESSAVGTYESLLNDSILMLLIPISMIVLLQYYLIGAIFVLGITVLVPVGIVLRAFPFIRGIGGTLIALGIGLSIIYPTLLILINIPITEVVGSGFNPASSTSQPNSVNFLVNTVLYLLPNPTSFFTAFASIGTIYPSLNVVTNSAIILLTQLLLFIFDLMIAYPLIDSIAKSLGGTIRLELGGKLKIR